MFDLQPNHALEVFQSIKHTLVCLCMHVGAYAGICGYLHVLCGGGGWGRRVDFPVLGAVLTMRGIQQGRHGLCPQIA